MRFFDTSEVNGLLTTPHNPTIIYIPSNYRFNPGSVRSVDCG